MNTTEKFFLLHRQAGPLVLPNVWDAASARIFENLGATAIATTSAGVAWSLGYPDGHKMPAKLQAELAARINRVIKVPLSMDFENGYSDNPAVVAENIKPLLDAGVSGINIEDGRDSPALLASKIEAIRQAVSAHGSNLFVNARTDVYLASLVPAERQVEETINRSAIYRSAGADGLFVPVITNDEEIGRIAKAISLPLNVMAMPGLSKADQLGKRGVKRLSAGAGVAQIAWQHAARLAKTFLAEGDSSLFDEPSFSGAELQQLFAGR